MSYKNDEHILAKETAKEARKILAPILKKSGFNTSFRVSKHRYESYINALIKTAPYDFKVREGWYYTTKAKTLQIQITNKLRAIATDIFENEKDEYHGTALTSLQFSVGFENNIGSKV